ncbi:MAG: hypothetical protein HC941_22500 [Microcoleus sp. SU_5_3]|nr:hypothetical protein [Microcoleus sp. SU_5_3]
MENLFALSESYFKIQKEDPRERNEIAQQEFLKLALKIASFNNPADFYSLANAKDKQQELITFAMTQLASKMGGIIGATFGGPTGAVIGSFAGDIAARYAAPIVNEAVNDAKTAFSILGNQISESQIFNPFNSDYNLIDWLINPKYAFWNQNRERGNFKW